MTPRDRANCLAAFMANINVEEVNAITQAIEAAVAEEREACARIAETRNEACGFAADAIRARGARSEVPRG